MNMSITRRAKDAIGRYSRTGETVPMITWSVESDNGGGKWIVGFIEVERAEQAPTELVQEIEGTTFIVDGPGQYLHLLEGAELDYVGDRFVFRKPA
jgi:hypothetical protein